MSLSEEIKTTVIDHVKTIMEEKDLIFTETDEVKAKINQLCQDVEESLDEMIGSLSDSYLKEIEELLDDNNKSINKDLIKKSIEMLNDLSYRIANHKDLLKKYSTVDNKLGLRNTLNSIFSFEDATDEEKIEFSDYVLHKLDSLANDFDLSTTASIETDDDKILLYPTPKEYMEMCGCLTSAFNDDGSVKESYLLDIIRKSIIIPISIIEDTGEYNQYLKMIAFNEDPDLIKKLKTQLLEVEYAITEEKDLTSEPIIDELIHDAEEFYELDDSIGEELKSVKLINSYLKDIHYTLERYTSINYLNSDIGISTMKTIYDFINDTYNKYFSYEELHEEFYSMMRKNKK